MNKIRASQIKPGMVVDVGGEGRKLIYLVTAVEGRVEVVLTIFDLHDPYHKYSTTIDGEDRVKVINGKKRMIVIDRCLEAVYKRKMAVEGDIDTLRLIKAMSTESI